MEVVIVPDAATIGELAADAVVALLGAQADARSSGWPPGPARWWCTPS